MPSILQLNLTELLKKATSTTTKEFREGPAFGGMDRV